MWQYFGEMWEKVFFVYQSRWEPLNRNLFKTVQRTQNNSSTLSLKPIAGCLRTRGLLIKGRFVPETFQICTRTPANDGRCLVRIDYSQVSTADAGFVTGACASARVSKCWWHHTFYGTWTQQISYLVNLLFFFYYFDAVNVRIGKIGMMGNFEDTERHKFVGT